MSLRSRLVAALLLVALLPTAVFTVFTLVELDRATRRWFRPGVERALESAQRVDDAVLARLEAMTRARAAALARGVPTAPLGEDARARLAAALRDGGLDFLQLYRRDGGRWARSAQVLPAAAESRGGAGRASGSVPDLAAELGAALAGDGLVRSPRGALAFAVRLDTARALAAGLRVPAGLFADVERVREGRGAYSRLGVMVDVQRPLIALLVGTLVAALVLLALLLAHLLARPVAHPLAELSVALDRVAGGDLAVRVKPRGARELRDIARAFNAMTARLEDARDAMAEAEREAAWRGAARKLAHEFKNILTPLQLSLQLLERGVAALPGELRARAGENLAAALAEVDQLARLADQFSQYARLPEPHLERLDLAAVARAAAARPMCEGVGVTCTVGEAVPVRGDGVLLARAAHNLVLNACEASSAGAVVEVAARREEDRALLEVLDRGGGVPAAVAGRVFEPYVSTKRRGSGLGLSLVRDIARQHGGSVTLEDRPGGGARARLVLPLAREDGAAR
jgi:nitrogen fixation/metabolism regulation signal transduction histidine kinase